MKFISLQGNVVADSLQQLQNTAQAATETVKKTSLVDIIFSGGILGQTIMVVLFIILFLTIFFYIERLIAISAVNKKEDDLMPQIKQQLATGRVAEALQFCKSTNSPTARMIAKGIARIGKPIENINMAMENAGKLEVYKLEKNVGYLSTFAGAGPMIGFLGTVIGMVLSFKQMADAQNSRIDMSMLSEGVYTAMITTVFGLIIGIIAYFGYNQISGKIDRFAQKLEANASEFFDLLNEPV